MGYDLRKQPAKHLLSQISRRAALTALLAAPLVSAPLLVTLGTRTARAAAPIRLGILQYGTVQWIAETIRANHLDTQHAIELDTTTLANTDAGRVALMAGSADIVVSDWMFVASQRAAGTPLVFAPLSSATGDIMVPTASPLRTLKDLAGHSLGIAGGPVDKSWLVVQAAAKQTAGIDLAHEATLTYGAPPLLEAKLKQGELDAVLTFWNYAARLQAAGYRSLISVGDCARALGVHANLAMVGFVFHENWARAHRQALDGFLDAAADAEQLLAKSNAAWQTVRPLMQAPDEALFAALRERFISGIAHPPHAEQERGAAELFAIMLRVGGPRATAGLNRLPDGIFWPDRHEGT
jgi:NitT/TauT family transport system substrate-binding protein